MAKIHKIITAGPLSMETIYTAPSPRDSIAARQGKRQLARDATRDMNKKTATLKLELQLAANIRPGDWKIVMTYRPDRLPPNREAAKKDFSAFIRKLRRPKGARCYFYRLEHKHKIGTNYHFHIYMTAGPETKDELETLWGNGFIYLDRIVIDKDNTYEQLARYMVKETPDKLGQHLFDHSHHIRKPQCERVWVSDDTQLEAPPGAMVLTDSGKVESVYGSYRRLKYMAL